MERLTFEGNFCDISQCRNVPGGSFCEDGACYQKKVWERLKSYEDTGLTPKEVTAQGELFDYALKESKPLAEQLTLLKHIRELAEADKDGRVVVLPCKVGDTVWANLDGMRHTRKCVIEFANIGSHVTTIVFSTVDGLREQYGVNPSSFGKSVFLTREEAEKALQEMEGKE